MRRRDKRDPWRHLTPEVMEIVKENLLKIHNAMEPTDGKKRQASEEERSDQKSQHKNEEEESS